MLAFCSLGIRDLKSPMHLAFLADSLDVGLENPISIGRTQPDPPFPGFYLVFLYPQFLGPMVHGAATNESCSPIGDLGLVHETAISITSSY